MIKVRPFHRTISWYADSGRDVWYILYTCKFNILVLLILYSSCDLHPYRLHLSPHHRLLDCSWTSTPVPPHPHPQIHSHSHQTIPPPPKPPKAVGMSKMWRALVFLLTSVSLGWHRLQNGMQQLGQYLPNSVTDRPWCVNMGIKYLCGGG